MLYTELYYTHVFVTGVMWPTARTQCASTCLEYGQYGLCDAERQYRSLPTPLRYGEHLLVESNGSELDGTYCKHWSEQQLGNELMTGKHSCAT
jgi:hypothetical protein